MHLLRLLFFTTLLAASTAAAAPAFAAPKNDDDFVDAMRRAFREPYQNQHQRAVLQLLDFLTPQNADRVGKLFGEFNEDGIRRDFAWGAYWRRLGEVDGAATLDALVAGRDPHDGYWHYEAVMEGWATVDPAAAERWLRAHPEAKHFWALYQRVIAAWARTDADRATQILFDLGKDEKYIADALPVLADTLRLVGGTGRIAAWFETLNDSGKQVAINHAAWRIKDGDLAAAVKWFAAQADKPWRDDQHFGAFLDRYVDANPMAAMAWAAALPPPPGGTDPAGLQSGMKRWALQDEVTPPKWLAARQTQTWWPRAASGYVQALREKKNAVGAESFLQGLAPEVRAAVERVLQR